MPKRVAAALTALAVLSGCATGTVDCTNVAVGACKLNFARLATDTALQFQGQGFAFGYNSNPNAQTTAAILDSFGKLLGALIGMMAKAPAGGVSFAPRAEPRVLPEGVAVPMLGHTV